MLAQTQKFKVLGFITYTEATPVRRLGPLRFGGAPMSKTAEVLRVFPADLQLPASTPYEEVVRQILAQDCQPLLPEILNEIVFRQVPSKRGYVVAPLVGGRFDHLMSQGGVLQRLDHALLPGTVERAGYSVIVRRA